MGPLFTSAAVFRDKAKPASGTATAPGIKAFDESTQSSLFWQISSIQMMTVWGNSPKVTEVFRLYGQAPQLG
jgi:hypothetical protein